MAADISPQYLANQTQPIAYRTPFFFFFFAKFVPVLTTLYMLKNFSVRFCDRFYDFRALTIMGKSTIRHSFLFFHFFFY